MVASILVILLVSLTACQVSVETPSKADGEQNMTEETADRKTEPSRAVVAEVLKAINEATDEALHEWQFRIESGTSPENVDRRPWTQVRLRHSSKEYRVRYRKEVGIPAVFAGGKISGGRAELQLSISGPVDYTGEVFVNGESKGKIPERDPATLGTEIPPILLTENAKPGDTFAVEIALFNSLIYPPHEFLDASKSISFRSARLVLEKAERMKTRLREFAVNLEAGNILLRPWKPNPRDKRVYWPELVDRSKIDTKERRRLRNILQESAAKFDLDALRSGESERVQASVEEVIAELAPVGEFAKTFTIYLVGNAHIDLAWLWRTNESVRIAANTFSSVLNNMEEFPGLVFAQSQAQAYHWVEQNYPDLFAKIQETFKSGHWDVVGGMWAEPDCNLPSGESFIRQVLYGQRYFKEKFGATAWLGWNPDSFGYNWNLPQIFSKAGIKTFITQKISWNDTTIFPYHLFWWEAPDGSRILTYFPTGSYTERVDPARMVEQLMRFEYDNGLREVLVLFGLGNHGGGPNREMLQRVEMLKRQPVYPNVEFSRAHDFLERIMERDLSELPVWRSELYMEGHRGTYTTQADTKRNNRACESLLETTEKAAGIAALLGAPYPKEELEQAWKTVLLNQFHDILPGSSITPVYRDADETYAHARRLIGPALEEALASIAENAGIPEKGWRNLIVFNPLSWDRTDVVRVSLPENAPEQITVEDADGKQMKSRVILSADGLDRELLFIADEVPSVGYKIFTLVEQPPAEAATDIKTGEYFIENSFLKVEVDPKTGNISSIYDKRNGKEVLADGEQGNRLELYENLPSYWDAWNIGYTDNSWTIEDADSVELVESGPVRAIIRVKKSFLGLSKANRAPTEGFPSSFFIQDITLYDGSPKVDITLHSDWWEDHTLLKVAFPLNVTADSATFEIPFGSISRPTKREEPWEKARFEVPVHRWADLSTEGYGASLLNDGKYGMDAEGNVMRLTILTSPLWPDPFADRGRHACTYSIYPHAGGPLEALTQHRAQELNLPLAACFVAGGAGDMPAEKSFFSVDKDGVVLTCIKRAEDSEEYVLRLVETQGRETAVILSLPRQFTKASEIDLLEEAEIRQFTSTDNTLQLNLGPCEVKSIKLKF